MRGEQVASTASNSVPEGSPPRARGADRPGQLGTPGLRITSACAGSSRHNGDGQHISRDHCRRRVKIPISRVADNHPRVRGEQSSSGEALNDSGGSPPRARGAEDRRGHDVLHDRITPACAGSRRSRTRAATWSGDLPRVRGEQGWSRSLRGWSGWTTPACAGSRPTCMGGVTMDSRITPACAGSSGWAVKADGTAEGSPPRARGAARQPRRARQDHGITPACAGSS